MKKNCWEFFDCGRIPGGDQVQEFGVCPAYAEARTDGMHGGVNGGRVCWAVTGTFCGGKVRGRFAEKIPSCLECAFYWEVMHEEKETLILFDEVRKVLSQTPQPQLSEPPSARRKALPSGRKSK